MTVFLKAFAKPVAPTAIQMSRDLQKAWVFAAVTMAIAIMVLFPDMAMAGPTLDNVGGGAPAPLSPNSSAPSTLGGMICNIKATMGPYAKFCGALAYVVGAFLCVFGLFSIKKHVESPNESLAKGIAQLVVGGMFLSFPAFAGIIQGSLFGTVGGGSAAACAAGVAAAGAATDLGTMMQNFVKDIYTPITMALGVLAFMVGVTFVFRGLLGASKIGSDPRAGAPAGIIANLVIGGILVSLSSMLTAVLSSLFGTGGSINNVASFAGVNWGAFSTTAGDTTTADNTVKAVLAFVQIIGLISFLRGWMVLKAAIAGGGQATVPQGLTHIIGGAMAINIVTMLTLINATFGMNLMR